MMRRVDRAWENKKWYWETKNKEIDWTVGEGFGVVRWRAGCRSWTDACLGCGWLATGGDVPCTCRRPGAC